jgi:adenylyltransferase/sulfurtransferase
MQNIPQLTDYDLARYNRQILISGWGQEGQSKLKAATVFIAGAGGLGSPVSLYLAVAGVGEIRICDVDTVDLSNLNRQILHSDMRLGQSKAESAGVTLREWNPSIRVVPICTYLDQKNAAEIIGQPAIVVDCLDNYETRYVLNSYCLTHHIPLVHGAVWGMFGQLTFIHPPETPCLKCLTPEAPPKAMFPVVGVTPGLIGSLQAMEVLKYITGVGVNLKGKLLTFDGADASFLSLNIRRVKDCPECNHLP